MISEKEFEDIICKYPELIEESLIFKGRQLHLYGKIIDVLFEDKFGQKLIVELKIGPVDRKHIGQVMEYEGSILSVEDPTARIMLLGNRVPPNLKKALDHHGIEWKEITLSTLKEFIASKKDPDFSNYFLEEKEAGAFVEQVLDVVSQDSNSGRSMLGDKDIDWRLPESHLSLIRNKNTLERVNYLRNKIKELGKDVTEGGRRKWINYRVNGKIFACIGEFRKNGDFWPSINFYHKDVYLHGYEVKSWGTTNWAIVKFGPTTSYSDLDKFVEWAKRSYHKNQ